MLRRFLVLIPVVALLATAIPAPVAAVECDPNDPICQSLTEAKDQQGQMQAQLDEIKNRIKDIQQKVVALDAVLQALQAQIADQNARIAATQAQIDDLGAQIRQKEADIVRQQATIEVRQQYLDQRVRSMDKHGRLNYLELLVTSRDFNQLLDRVLIMQDIVRSDSQLLGQLRDQKVALGRLRDDLGAKQAAQQQLLGQLNDQKARLVASRAQQQQALDIQKSLEAQFETQRLALEAQKKQIDGQVNQLQDAYNNRAVGLGGGTGQFLWPEGSRNITQGFGCSTLLGEPYDPRCPSRHTHTGIDLGGPYRTPIYAADAGVVATYPTNYGYGNYIIIIHGNGWSTLYGHMDSFAVRNQAAVVKGQVIGYEGSTGYSTGAHLHFEIRFNNAPQNPCLYLGC